MCVRHYGAAYHAQHRVRLAQAQRDRRAAARPAEPDPVAITPVAPAALVDAIGAVLAGPQLPPEHRAACADQPHEWWDPRSPDEPHAASRARQDRAIAVCQQCPALAACRALAGVLGREFSGAVWGGAVVPWRRGTTVATISIATSKLAEPSA